MIKFENELKRFSPIPGVDQAEDAIYNNDLRDLSDIVSMISEEMREAQNNNNSMASRIRR